MTRKTFERGEEVEIQREVCGTWEPCSYIEPSRLRAHHIVRLLPGAPRNVVYHGSQEFECDALCIPSRRIRKRSVTK